jgi:hypothetical protein
MDNTTLNKPNSVVQWALMYDQETKKQGHEGKTCRIKSFDKSEKTPFSFESEPGFFRKIAQRIAELFRSILHIQKYNIASQLTRLKDASSALEEKDVYQIVKETDAKVGDVYTALTSFSSFIDECRKKLPEDLQKNKLAELNLEKMQAAWRTFCSHICDQQISDILPDLSISFTPDEKIKLSSNEKSLSIDQIVEMLGLEKCDFKDELLSTIIGNRLYTIQDWMASQLQSFKNASPIDQLTTALSLWTKVQGMAQRTPLLTPHLDALGDMFCSTLTTMMQIHSVANKQWITQQLSSKGSSPVDILLHASLLLRQINLATEELPLSPQRSPLQEALKNSLLKNLRNQSKNIETWIKQELAPQGQNSPELLLRKAATLFKSLENATENNTLFNSAKAYIEKICAHAVADIVQKQSAFVEAWLSESMQKNSSSQNHVCGVSKAIWRQLSSEIKHNPILAPSKAAFHALMSSAVITSLSLKDISVQLMPTNNFSLCVTIEGEEVPITDVARQISSSICLPGEDKETIYRKVLTAIIDRIKTTQNLQPYIVDQMHAINVNKFTQAVSKLKEHLSEHEKRAAMNAPLFGTPPILETDVESCTSAIREVESLYISSTEQVGAFLMNEGGLLLDEKTKALIGQDTKDTYMQACEQIQSAESETVQVAFHLNNLQRMKNFALTIGGQIDNVHSIPNDRAGYLINVLHEISKGAEKIGQGCEQKKRWEMLFKEISEVQNTCSSLIKTIDALSEKQQKKTETGNVIIKNVQFHGAVNNSTVFLGINTGTIINQPNVCNAAVASQKYADDKKNNLKSVIGKTLMATAVGATQGLVFGGVPGMVTMGIASAIGSLASVMVSEVGEKAGIPTGVTNAIGSIAAIAATQYAGQYIGAYIQGVKQQEAPLATKNAESIKPVETSPKKVEKLIGPELPGTLDATSMPRVEQGLTPNLRGTAISPPVSHAIHPTKKETSPLPVFGPHLPQDTTPKVNLLPQPKKTVVAEPEPRVQFGPHLPPEIAEKMKQPQAPQVPQVASQPECSFLCGPRNVVYNAYSSTKNYLHDNVVAPFSESGLAMDQLKADQQLLDTVVQGATLLSTATGFLQGNQVGNPLGPVTNAPFLENGGAAANLVKGVVSASL